MNAENDYEGFHSDFCPVCGGLIELETIDEVIHCQICGSQRSFQEFAGKSTFIQVKSSRRNCTFEKIKSGCINMKTFGD
jgi:DNA-directed RNA polymerase subunit M/transcription elongation factor TFIIS